MPHLGLRGSFYVLVVVMCLGAFLIAWVNQRPRLAFSAAGLGVLLAITGFSTGEGWRHVLSSGVFRMRGTHWDPEAMMKRRKYVKILFYEDAADATVSVEQGDGVVAKDDIGLRINGKVDASSRVDLSTQYLCAHLPMAVRPESKDVFILGVGSGISAGALLGHPIERIVVAENCEPVIRAAKYFGAWNRDVLANPRVEVRNEDARTVLKLSPHAYDVIICEPSNPWTVGVGSIFSREFYELAGSRLKDSGVVCQWFHVYEMSDGIVSMVLRTFASVFPAVEIWDPGSGDILMLGGKRPFKSSAEVYRTIFERPEVRKDMEAIGIKSPEALWARQLASQGTAFAIPGRGPIQSDLFPVLEYEAPRAFFIGATAAALSLFDERTWQKDLMAQDKRAALVQLDVPQLISIFAVYTSVNEQLNRYVSLRFHSESNPGAVMDDGTMPCIFRPANAQPIQPQIPDSASAELRNLIGVDVALRANPENWQGPIDVIEGILRAHQAAGSKQVDWSPANFALLAAKTCVRHGNVDRAKAFVALGLQNDPQGAELLYLRRVLERQSPLLQAGGLAGR
jgi:hypothetical protein